MDMDREKDKGTDRDMDRDMDRNTDRDTDRDMDGYTDIFNVEEKRQQKCTNNTVERVHRNSFMACF
jgi:hypothetical protein